MPLFLHNGSILVNAGSLAASANCCCGQSCLGAKIDFHYLVDPPGGITNPNGSHNIHATANGWTVENSCETWNGTWSDPPAHVWVPGSCPASGSGNGRASIEIIAKTALSGVLRVLDNRTFSSPVWSGDITAYITVNDLAANTEVEVGGTTYTANGTYQIDQDTKTNTNVYDKSWNFEVRAR